MKFKRAICYVCLLSVICFVSIGAMVSADGKDVTVKYIDRFSGHEEETEYKTQHTTVEEFIAENDIKKGQYDRLSHSDDCAIVDGTEITVTKAVPITVVMGDNVYTTVTTMPTVGRALMETGMAPGEDDIVTPSGETSVTEGMQIVIIPSTTEEVIRTEYTDYDTVYREDNKLEEGKTKIIQSGVKGQTQVTYRMVYRNGEQISCTETGRLKVSDPREEIIAKGTKKKVASTPSPQKTSTPKKSATKTVAASSGTGGGVINGLKYKKSMEMTATAYSAFNSKGGYAKTASGMTARKGIVAVDRSVIPLGTRLYIEGYGEAIAGDVGGAIKGNKIDLCFEDTNKNLMKFGRQKVKVYILE